MNTFAKKNRQNDVTLSQSTLHQIQKQPHQKLDTNEQNGREIFQLVSVAMRVGDNNISAV